MRSCNRALAYFHWTPFIVSLPGLSPRVVDVKMDHCYAKDDQSAETVHRAPLQPPPSAGQGTCYIPCGKNITPNLELYPQLKTWLPPGYQYHVCSYETSPSLLDHDAFQTVCRFHLKTVEEFQEWLSKTKDTPVTWRVWVTRPRKGGKILYKADYKCQHNVQVRSWTADAKKTSKNTQCPAILKVTLGQTNTPGRRPMRSKDPHLPQFNTIVHLQNIHNHNVFATAALRHRDVSHKTIDKLTTLFEMGHSPTAALLVLKTDLQSEYGEHYTHASADRAICPNLQFCYRLYTKIHRKHKTLRPLRSYRTKSSKPRARRRPVIASVCEQDTGAEIEVEPSAESDAEDHPFVPNSSERGEVQSMTEDMRTRWKDPTYSQALSAMARQYHRLKHNPSKLESALYSFGRRHKYRKSKRAARRQDTVISNQPNGARGAQYESAG